MMTEHLLDLPDDLLTAVVQPALQRNIITSTDRMDDVLDVGDGDDDTSDDDSGDDEGNDEGCAPR